MAYGSELYLGIVGQLPVKALLEQMGIKYTTRVTSSRGRQVDDIDLVKDENLKHISDGLKVAHKDALEDMGLEIIDPSRIARSDGKAVEAYKGYVYVQGLDGVVRQTSIWNLEIDYDPREMGHEPQDVLLGVSLISRYFPVFLDWNKEHGGSGDPDMFVLTPDRLKTIEIARKHIAKVLPFIQDAPIIFRERHY